jgi:RNA polymerase sigma factor (sigma-70 family)
MKAEFLKDPLMFDGIIKKAIRRFNLPKDSHEDAMQLARLNLFKYLDDYDPERGSIDHFVYLTARSAVVEIKADKLIWVPRAVFKKVWDETATDEEKAAYLRSLNLHPIELALPIPAPVSADSLQPETLDALYTAIDQLPKKSKAVIKNFLKNEQIYSPEIQTTRSAQSYLFKRAIRKLRKTLPKWVGESLTSPPLS